MKGRKITVFRLCSLAIITALFILVFQVFHIAFMLITFVAALLLGRIWCGYICPLGFYQEMISLLRKKLRIPGLSIPSRMKSALKPIRYIILVAFVISMLFMGTKPLIYIRPDKVFLSEGAGIFSVIVLGVMTGICFLSERFFCRICPLGTARGFANKISLVKIKKKGSACTHCRACLEVCPMDIDEVYKERDKEDVTKPDCIFCMKCIEACPEKDALSFTIRNKTLLSSKRNTK